MDKKLKSKWVKALRSGKIEQARGALIDEKGAMCCLGVLGRICGLEDDYLRANAGAVRGDRLDILEAKIGHGDEIVDQLAQMNDGKCERYKRARSFKQIAAYIEKRL